jgi:hypothetical protein
MSTSSTVNSSARFLPLTRKGYNMKAIYNVFKKFGTQTDRTGYTLCGFEAELWMDGSVTISRNF